MLIYELNTRAHCQRFDLITEAELSAMSDLGFDAIWFMGVWRISEGAKKISKVVSDSYEGSPYAIRSYELNPDLGGLSAFQQLAERAHSAGLRVIVDFIPNHLALDSPWIDESPEFFIKSNSQFRQQNAGDYFLHASGEVIAFGRDPYFPPWYDTAQLDYTCPELRLKMIQVLKWISQLADGVRCDMAMLILRDYIRQQWYPLAPEKWFDQRLPGEFWEEAIAEVKAIRPDFTFLAEAYWDKEQRLLDLGFDLCYEKRLYDGLVARDITLIAERLNRSQESLRRSLFFIENNDEQRAAAVFSRAENLAAAGLMLSLPGSVLIHEGQMEGLRQRLPVQQVTPIAGDEVDLALKAAYELLVRVTNDDVFREGAFQLFDCGGTGFVSFIRQDSTRSVAYLGQLAKPSKDLGSTQLDVTPLARAASAHNKLRLTNLLNCQTVAVELSSGAYFLHPESLYASDESRDEPRFLLVRAEGI